MWSKPFGWDTAKHVLTFIDIAFDCVENYPCQSIISNVLGFCRTSYFYATLLAVLSHTNISQHNSSKAYASDDSKTLAMLSIGYKIVVATRRGHQKWWRSFFENPSHWFLPLLGIARCLAALDAFMSCSIIQCDLWMSILGKKTRFIASFVLSIWWDLRIR